MSEQGSVEESDGGEVIDSLSTEEETTGRGEGCLWNVGEGEGGERRSLWKVAWKRVSICRSVDQLSQRSGWSQAVKDPNTGDSQKK